MKGFARTAILAAACLGLTAPRLLFAQAEERTLYVSVLDKNGVPVPAVSPSDIVVREDDAPREVLRVVPATDPMQLALLVDNSTAGEPLIREYREALTAFVSGVLEEAEPRVSHRISLIGLAARPTVLRDYTSDPKLLTESAQRIFSESDTGTYLLDAIFEIGGGLQKGSSTRPVIVAVITEGPELSNRDYLSVLSRLRDTRAAFHVIIVGRPINDTLDRTIVITRGPSESGGSYSNVLASSALSGRMKQLAAELTHQYRVTYARPQRLIPPERVTVSAARPELVVRGTPSAESPQQERR
jgi:hypothetical protein